MFSVPLCEILEDLFAESLAVVHRFCNFLNFLQLFLNRWIEIFYLLIEVVIHLVSFVD
jgi:hypothetical protein